MHLITGVQKITLQTVKYLLFINNEAVLMTNATQKVLVVYGGISSVSAEYILTGGTVLDVGQWQTLSLPSTDSK